MEMVHGSDIWSPGNGKGDSATYGPDGEYDLEELREDVEEESNLLKALGKGDKVDVAYDYLEAYALRDGLVTGEDIQNTLEYTCNNYLE